MALESTNKTVSHSNIVMKNLGVKRPRTQHIWSIPGERADSAVMLAWPFKGTHALRCLNVPQLYLLVGRADRDLRFINLIGIKSLGALTGSPGD